VKRAASIALVVLQTLSGLAVLYAAGLIAFAFAIGWAESWTFGNSLWWSMVTATTVGYGDMSPETTAGRIIAGVVMHFGPGFIFPMATAIISMRLIVDDDAFTHEEQEQIKANQALIIELLEKHNGSR